jgi:2-hydroxy-3-oxopropionate reductase
MDASGGTRPAVALLGLGNMGLPMARNLAAAGLPLTVWNRSPGRSDGLGVRVAQSPAEAATGADAVVLMLADGRASAEVLGPGGVLDACRPGTLVIDMASIPPELARRHAMDCVERGLGHLDAPVSGGTTGAEAGTLAIMVGGTPEDFERARPVLTPLGRATLVGPAGAGQLAKLANQVIVAVTIGAVAEGLLLAAAGGADPAAVVDALRGGFADGPILRGHGARMIARDFVPGGRSRWQLKDLDTVAAEAEALGLVLPLAETVRAAFRTLVGHGGADLDHSALALELERLNPGWQIGMVTKN